MVHPNVVRTYDFGESESVQYLALEWAAGEPLESFLTKSGNLTPPVAANIVDQLGAALQEAHKSGIIHRDLKPANIMYDPAEQKVRLLDFGIARDAELPAEERLTRAGFFVGTLQYVSPESLSGELVGEQADVYSLAVIAYQMLTEVTPFPGKNPRELFQQLLTQDPIPLNQATKGLKFSARLEEVVMKGWRAKRPQALETSRPPAPSAKPPRPSPKRRASSRRCSSATEHVGARRAGRPPPRAISPLR